MTSQPILMAAAVILTAAMAQSAESSAFSLEIDGNKFVMVNGSAKADNDNGTISFRVSFGGEETAFGYYMYPEANSKVRLDCLMVAQDDASAKRVEMMSAPFDFEGLSAQFLVNIETRADKPYILVESSLMNLADTPNALFFTWTLKMKSDRYHTGLTESKAAFPWKKMPVSDMLYMPSEKSQNGLGIAIDGSPADFEFYSNINSSPGRGWANAIWGISKNKCILVSTKKDAAATLNFVLFPAKNPEEAIGTVNGMRKSGMFLQVWNKSLK